MLILILLLVDHIDLKLNGKVENLAKVMDRLKAYNNEFDSIYDLYPSYCTCRNRFKFTEIKSLISVSALSWLYLK